MLFPVKYFKDVEVYILVDAGSPTQKAFWCPVAYKTVCRGHVVFFCRVIIGTLGAWMYSNALIVIEDLYGVTGVHQFYLFTNEAIRNTVIVFINAHGYMSVLHHRSKELFF